MIERWRRLYRWNAWANETVLGVLRQSNGEPRPALAAFQHILEAEQTWLGRLDGDGPANVPLWAGADLARCEAWYPELVDRANTFLANLGDGDLDREFSYVRSGHGSHVNRIEDALTHLLLHSQQYRGEAAAFLNAAGHRVPDFDLIFWMRAQAE